MFIEICVFCVICVLEHKRPTSAVFRFNERYLLLGGFVVCLLGFLVYLPWGHHYPDIQYAIDTHIGQTRI